MDTSNPFPSVPPVVEVFIHQKSPPRKAREQAEHRWSLPPREETVRRGIAFDRQPSAVAVQDRTGNRGPATESSVERAQTRRLNSSFRGAAGFTASSALHMVTSHQLTQRQPLPTACPDREQR